MIRWIVLFAVCASAQTITEEKVYGRRAWVLSNGLMRVALLAGGGHIAEVRLVSDDPKKNINPMRVPHYQTIEPWEYDEAKHSRIFGDTPHRWLHSGYMGHLLCFPIYGPPSADEARAGLGNHGEAPIVEWRQMRIEKAAGSVTLWYGADLPKTNFRVERAVTMREGVRAVRIREWVENRADFDRPINWMEHATFGPPFAEPGKTVLDASVTAGKLGNADVEWPGNRRVFQPAPHSGSYMALRLDPARSEQFFTLFHPDYRVLIGYVFPAAATPWLADWQENRANNTPPWNGQVVARGIEWGSSPFAEGLRKSVERGSLLGAPAFQWIGARQRLEREFTIFLAEIPQGFPGVKDVRLDNGSPVVSTR